MCNWDDNYRPREDTRSELEKHNDRLNELIADYRASIKFHRSMLQSSIGSDEDRDMITRYEAEIKRLEGMKWTSNET